MSDYAIRVENLSKLYRIGGPQARYKTLRDAIMDVAASPVRRLRRLGQPTPPEETIWALKDVSFEVKHGEVLGIIGRNGAGKTTLLRILSRITEPTEGQAEIHGRVGSLLEVGTGFHPELTGRENIYLNGAILGMKRSEIDQRFDEIVAFSEIEKFLDTPVKRYSSGMYVRLAFAVAAHLEPEILVVDEVLAVGDAAFQKKCLGKMGDVAREGRTVLFVSHNMAAVENLCSGAMLLDEGHLIHQGGVLQLITYYLQTVLASTTEGVALVERKDRSGNARIRLTNFHIEDAQGNKLSTARSGMDVGFVFGFECSDQEIPRKVDVGFSIHSSNGQTLLVLYSSYLGETFDEVPSTGAFRCLVPKLPLSAGHYRVGARITVGGEEADWPRNGVGDLEVMAGDFYGTGSEGFGRATPFLLSGTWCVQET